METTDLENIECEVRVRAVQVKVERDLWLRHDLESAPIILCLYPSRRGLDALLTAGWFPVSLASVLSGSGQRTGAGRVDSASAPGHERGFPRDSAPGSGR